LADETILTVPEKIAAVSIAQPLAADETIHSKQEALAADDTIRTEQVLAAIDEHDRDLRFLVAVYLADSVVFG
jgi:hypothetical protein